MRAARPGRRITRRRQSLDVLLLVGVGGAVGTLARHELAVAFPTHAGAYPWAIFTVNVVGAFVLGAVMTLVLERLPPTRYVRPLAGIGFCGGLTTFSSWMLDDVLLADAGRSVTAVVYVLASIVAGLGATFSGVVVVRALTGPRRIGGVQP